MQKAIGTSQNRFKAQTKKAIRFERTAYVIFSAGEGTRTPTP